jgi:hypothetical protein
MKSNSMSNTLVKSPTQKELILQLLKQELKSYRFFNGLREVGLDDSFYHSDFSSLVLTYDFYFALLEKYSAYFQPSEEVVMKLALSVYLKLMAG